MRYLIPLAIILLAGCEPESQPPTVPPIELYVSPETPIPGQDVTLTLENLSAASIGYNLCASTLVRDERGQWVEIPSDRVCTMELRGLEPGERDDFTLEMPTELPTGVYRFRTTLDEVGGPSVLDSHMFLITEIAPPDTTPDSASSPR